MVERQNKVLSVTATHTLLNSGIDALIPPLLTPVCDDDVSSQ